MSTQLLLLLLMLSVASHAEKSMFSSSTMPAFLGSV
jgi:hypothetical protein